MERLSKLSVAIRNNLPSHVRSNTIACARGGKWRASQVMIDYLANTNVAITPQREYIESTGHLSLAESVALRMKNEPFKSGDTVSCGEIRGTLIIEGHEWFFKPMGLTTAFKVESDQIERVLF